MRIPVFIICFSLVLKSFAQTGTYSLDRFQDHFLQKKEGIDGAISDLHFTMKPLQRNDINKFTDSLSKKNSLRLNSQLDFIHDDTWLGNKTKETVIGKPIAKYFFQTATDLFAFEKEGIQLSIRPVLQLSLGKSSEKSLYINTRGIEIRGMIDKKISFYSFLSENQANFPQYVMDYTNEFGVLPYEGFWKKYADGGVDFLNGRGDIQFLFSKHISAQLGYGKHFVGDGFRSLILSDFSNSYPYFRINTHVWKLQYTNLFAQLTARVDSYDGGTLGTTTYPSKYLAFHQISANIGHKINLSLFESVIISRDDSLGNQGFDWSYLNPVIFYRSLEQQSGSPDNAQLGITFRYLPFKKFRIYSQFLLDELVISELTSENGWWGNKYAWQMGLDYYDLLPQLDLKFEYNLVRPYTYSHENEFTAYTHYDMPLSHPLGANFKEMSIKLHYVITPKWHIQSTGFYALTGKDNVNENWGSNPLLSYNTIEREYQNRIGQGQKTDIYFFDTHIFYHFFHQTFLDFSFTYRNVLSPLVNINKSIAYVTFSFRHNIAFKKFEF